MKFQIIPVPILPFGVINAFIIKFNNKCILIDTGLPGTESKLEKVLAKNNLSFTDVLYIVVTHAHIDHAGNAHKLRMLTRAKIVAHEKDLKYYLQEQEMTFCPTSRFAKLFLATNFIRKPYQPFRPDILLKDQDSLCLSDVADGLNIISTPGHTAGSISVVLNNEHAFVGDLISSGILIGGVMLKNRPKSPPFEDEPVLVAAQLEKMVRYGARNFYLGHGGPLKEKEVMKHVCHLRR